MSPAGSSLSYVYVIWWFIFLLYQLCNKTISFKKPILACQTTEVRVMLVWRFLLLRKGIHWWRNVLCLYFNSWETKRFFQEGEWDHLWCLKKATFLSLSLLLVSPKLLFQSRSTATRLLISTDTLRSGDASARLCSTLKRNLTLTFVLPSCDTHLSPISFYV